MPVYSYSRLSVYETCPRQYKFQYVDRVEVPEEEEAVQLVLGSRVHEALEYLYRDLMRGRLRTLDEILEFYRQEWEEQWPARVRFPNPDDDPETYRIAGERYLTEYYQRYHPFDRERTLAVERRLMFPLDDEGKVRIAGHIDRLAISPQEVWEIRDYKTDQYLRTQGQLDEDRQLALYQIGVRHAWPQAEQIELVWHFLAHGAELRSRRTPEQLEGLRRDVLRQVRTIESDQEHRTVVGGHCDWCPYRPICPAWRHIARTEELPPEEFQRDAGVQLVDRYADLKRQEHELAAEIDTVKHQLVAFADHEQIDAVRGTHHQVTIRRETVVRYPGKDDPERPALEELVKQHGKWGEVSDLSLRALAKAVRTGEWPERLVSALHRFEQQEQAARIRLAKLRPDEGERGK
ncbi:MAG: RecB family exonuclease [Candidatus Methylomirabilia bacterium]